MGCDNEINKKTNIISNGRGWTVYSAFAVIHHFFCYFVVVFRFVRGLRFFIIVASRAVPIISGSNIKTDNSGMKAGDVSTVKVDPLFVRSETAANCVIPKLVAGSTV